MLVKGWHIKSGNAEGLILCHLESNSVIQFDFVINTPQDAVFACKFIRNREVSTANTETGVSMSMSIQKAHELLGHGDENTTRQSAKSLGWRITRGSLKPCVSYAVSKAKAKKASKKSDSPKPTTPCELVNMGVMPQLERSGLISLQPSLSLLNVQLSG